MKQMNFAFLSCDSLDGHVVDDDLLVKELEAHGHHVSTVPWTKDCDWKAQDAVIIRTTWDYMTAPQQFQEKLELIAKETRLLNSSEVVRWNIHKGYLRELGEQGVLVVPTVFFKAGEKIELPKEWTGNKFVMKPCISAGSYKTLLASRDDLLKENFSTALPGGEQMCQPFLENISSGEISLVYFDRKFSHGLTKVPKEGEFRVQEEFGGNVIPYAPSADLLSLAQKIIALVPFPILYARVDLIPYEGSFALMELELIEPSLYFRTHPHAAKNFHAALANFLK